LKFNLKTLLLITVLCQLFFNCTPSLVYSPSINLPPEPLKKKSVQVLGGIGFLPETRRHDVGESVALGGELTFRFGVSDYFTMQIKGWKDFSDNLDESRSGFSYTNIVVLNDIQSKYQVGFIPTFAFLFDDGGLEGGGAATQFGLWLPNNTVLHPYVAIGPGVGIRNLEENPKEWGWGVLTNLGLAWKISKYFNLNIEVAGIAQINEFEGKSNFVVAPSLNLGLIW